MCEYVNNSEIYYQCAGRVNFFISEIKVQKWTRKADIRRRGSPESLNPDRTRSFKTRQERKRGKFPLKKGEK